MLIPVQRLLDGLRHPKTRADDLERVRRLLVRQASEATPEETAIALTLRGLREAMAEAIGDVSSCGRCARGHPLPNGRFDGGHCCGARTEQLFTQPELRALRLAGTRPADMTPPAPCDHAGCAFRGERGCSLDVAHRPSLCVRYVCRELESELRERGDLPAIRAIGAKMVAAERRLGQLGEETRSDR